MRVRVFLGAAALALQALFANADVTISSINGNKYLSPLRNGQSVKVRGLVTAKGGGGFNLRQETDQVTTNMIKQGSNSIFVSSFGINAGSIRVGDYVEVGASVSVSRSTRAFLYVTTLENLYYYDVISKNNPVEPLILGEGQLNPPTEQHSSLDDGDILSLPFNRSWISVENPTLDPLTYGMDFWQSLSGELVTIKSPRAVSKSNKYQCFFIVGSWRTTGDNSRGGLTMTDKDHNPEALYVYLPLDKSSLPSGVKIGDVFEDITGIITYTGSFSIRPLTALKFKRPALPSRAPATTLVSDAKCRKLTFGVFNLGSPAAYPRDLTPMVGAIVNGMKKPDLIFVQETRPDYAENLVQAIFKSSGVEYAVARLLVDHTRPNSLYLYKPKILRLQNRVQGSWDQPNEVLPGPKLKYNPGSVDTGNGVSEISRQPLAAAWMTSNGRNKFFTINLHLKSRRGESPQQGDARTPINAGMNEREDEARSIAKFAANILAQNSSAKIIVAGDFNDFAFSQPVKTFAAESGMLNLDDVANVPPTERYTYVFDTSCRQLDHVFVSPALAASNAAFEHVHINTWASRKNQVTDHDPSVAMLDVCS